MAIKEYSILTRTPDLKSPNDIQFSFISRSPKIECRGYSPRFLKIISTDISDKIPDIFLMTEPFSMLLLRCVSLVWFYGISNIVDYLMSNSIIYLSVYIYIYIYIYITSSSCRAASMDISDHLSPLLPIIHRLRQVFRVTSCIFT